MTHPLTRRLLAEYLGSAFLAAVVIGSGIAAQQLSDDTGLQLLENAAATAAGLFAIILMFGPVSGGHFNPVVSLVDAAFGGLSRRDALAYIPAQIAGCISGAIVANAMFALSAVSIATTHRASPAHVFAEVIATFGLLLLIFALVRSGRAATAAGRRRRLHRRRLLVHQLHQLRQPGDHRRPHLLRHLRRHRPRVGSGVRRRPARRRGNRLRRRPRALPRRRTRCRSRGRRAARQRGRRVRPARRAPLLTRRRQRESAARRDSPNVPCTPHSHAEGNLTNALCCFHAI